MMITVMVVEELVKWTGWSGHFLVIKASKITYAEVCVENNQNCCYGQLQTSQQPENQTVLLL